MSTTGEETDGVESGGEESNMNVEFLDESEMTWDGLLFIGLKISATILK
jgi:hypothetical protein